ncbi:MAG: hypothetical protein AAFN92_17905, partial [Bacteroidota bacterium]
QHKHLPEIPSAREMEEEGIALAQMNVKLLQKIEELTLYAIEQEEKLRRQEKQLEGQANRLAKLELMLTQLLSRKE